MDTPLTRVLDVLNLDSSTASSVDVFFRIKNHSKALTVLLEEEGSNDERWNLSADVHQLIVAIEPEIAHEWLVIVTKKLCESRHFYNAIYWGSILGLLEAGVWLDKSFGQTPFQSKLLESIVAIVHSGNSKIASSNSIEDQNEYIENLQRALTRFIFPHTCLYRLPSCVSVVGLALKRLRETECVIEYLQRNLKGVEEVKLQGFAYMFIDQFTKCLSANMNPMERLMHYRPASL